MALRGRIDGVFEGMLRGWLWDPDQPSRRLFAEIALDGQPLARIRADRPRADLEAVGFGEGGAGFETPIPIQAQDGGEHELLLTAEQEWISIAVDRLALPIPQRLHMLRGRVEGIRDGHCVGWAWDGARPQERVHVELVQGGRVLAQQSAAAQRPDLRRAGIGDGAHGFSFDLAASRPEPGAALELRCNGSEAGWLGEWVVGTLAMPDRLMPAPRGVAEAMSRRQYLVAARQAEGEQDHAAAAHVLEAGLLQSPEDVDLLSIRARVHLAQQELEPAERLARAALQREPGHPRATLILARTLAALGRHLEAIEAWSAIGPEDPAFRERVTKRLRSLVALGRRAEAQHEVAMALREQPRDPEALRQMAATAEAAGAPRAALAHWRRLLAHAPQDPAGRERMRALEQLLLPPTVAASASPLASPLAHAELRDWQGPLEREAGLVACTLSPGLRLRALAQRVVASPLDPQQLHPGDIPGYGLRLRMEAGGAELGFALTAAAAGDLRMGLEASGPAGLVVALRPMGVDADERPLARLALEARPRLHRFDMILTEAERQALRDTGMELVLRLEGPGEARVRPPRALSRLWPPSAPAGGFEAPGLALPAPLVERQVRMELPDLHSPFTTIIIAAPPHALATTIQGVLDGTAAPFECVLGLRPDWPEALTTALSVLAMRDPRLRLLPPEASGATGWVALIEAPPSGGPGWLTALHHAAAPCGSAEAPGVLLEWCG